MPQVQSQGLGHRLDVDVGHEGPPSLFTQTRAHDTAQAHAVLQERNQSLQSRQIDRIVSQIQQFDGTVLNDNHMSSRPGYWSGKQGKSRAKKEKAATHHESERRARTRAVRPSLRILLPFKFSSVAVVVSLRALAR